MNNGLEALQPQVDQLQSDVDSFNHMQRWRRGHKLTGSQQDRIAQERGGLVSRGKALLGQAEESIGAPAAPPAAEAMPQTGAPVVSKAKPQYQMGSGKSFAPGSNSFLQSQAPPAPVNTPTVPGASMQAYYDQFNKDNNTSIGFAKGGKVKPQASSYILPVAAVEALGGVQSLDRMVSSIMGDGAPSGAISGPPGDDQVPGVMPNGDPARFNDGEYELPPEVVEALGGPQTLDKLVVGITGEQPGPTEKPPLPGQVAEPVPPADAYKCGGKVKSFDDGGELDPLARTSSPSMLWGVHPGSQVETELRQQRRAVLGPELYAPEMRLMSGETKAANEYVQKHGLHEPIARGPAPSKPPPSPRQDYSDSTMKKWAAQQPPAGPPAAPRSEGRRPAGVTQLPDYGPTQKLYRTTEVVDDPSAPNFGENIPSFYGATKQRGAPRSPNYGPTDHDRIMAGIEAKARLAVAKKLGVMSPSERGKLSPAEIIGTQHGDALRAAQERGQDISAALEARRLENAPEGPSAKDVIEAEKLKHQMQQETGAPAAFAVIDKAFEAEPNESHRAKAKSIASQILSLVGDGNLAGSLALEATQGWPDIEEKIIEEAQANKLPASQVEKLLADAYARHTAMMMARLSTKYPQLMQSQQ